MSDDLRSHEFWFDPVVEPLLNRFSHRSSHSALYFLCVWCFKEGKSFSHPLSMLLVTIPSLPPPLFLCDCNDYI